MEMESRIGVVLILALVITVGGGVAGAVFDWPPVGWVIWSIWAVGWWIVAAVYDVGNALERPVVNASNNIYGIRDKLHRHWGIDLPDD